MAPVPPEKQLEEMYAMVRENNRMLKDMRRDAFIGGVFQVIWWIVILLVLPYITWLFLAPYLESILSAYETAQGQSQEASEALKKLQELSTGFDLQSIIDRFMGGNATTTGE